MAESEETARRTDDAAGTADPNDSHGTAADRHAARRRALAVSFFATALAACGGGGGSDSPSPSPAPTPAPPPPAPPPSGTALDPADMAAARFLQQASVASTAADIASVRSAGASAWLENQFAMPIGQGCYDWFVAKGYSAIDEQAYYDLDYWVDFGIAWQLVKEPDSVRKRVALALSEQFVISVVGLNTMPWRCLAVGHYWDQLNQHAFGSFRQLLEAVTLNPAMGAYLNTKGNAKEDAASGRIPDENYAREVMQLFTIGLVKLNLDGTPVIGADGLPVPSYTQDEVSNLARVFTGYDWWDDGRRFPARADGYPRPYPEYTRRPMVFDSALHSTLQASFLGTTIAGGTDGATALRMALDTLVAHPNVGPFFGRQMIQRLVTSNPSPAYVARVAAAFNDNGSGVRGDLKAVWRAILLDEEARGAASLASTSHGKIREPMLRMFQWGRTFNLTSAQGTFKWSFDTGNPNVWYEQRPFHSPSVFNFFRPGYVPPGTVLAESGATAPEFQIVNESSAAQWVNALENVVYNGMYIVWPSHPAFPSVYAGPYPGDGFDMTPDHSVELAIAHDAPALVRRLNLLLAAGQLSAETEAAIVSILSTRYTLTAASSTTERRGRVGAALQLVMSMPEYIVQK